MAMKRRDFTLFFGGLAVGVVATALWYARGDATSCVIENMRGQPSSMQDAIVYYCQQEYGEFE